MGTAAAAAVAAVESNFGEQTVMHSVRKYLKSYNRNNLAVPASPATLSRSSFEFASFLSDSNLKVAQQLPNLSHQRDSSIRSSHSSHLLSGRKPYSFDEGRVSNDHNPLLQVKSRTVSNQSSANDSSQVVHLLQQERAKKLANSCPPSPNPPQEGVDVSGHSNIPKAYLKNLELQSNSHYIHFNTTSADNLSLGSLNLDI
jgi:hypothetical protein